MYKEKGKLSMLELFYNRSKMSSIFTNFFEDRYIYLFQNFKIKHRTQILEKSPQHLQLVIASQDQSLAQIPVFTEFN